MPDWSAAVGWVMPDWSAAVGWVMPNWTALIRSKSGLCTSSARPCRRAHVDASFTRWRKGLPVGVDASWVGRALSPGEDNLRIIDFAEHGIGIGIGTDELAGEPAGELAGEAGASAASASRRRKGLVLAGVIK
eukprot:7117177-Pyramimonas_sp.AAC.1